jgi:SMODS and SLOG-associating 2TM effector domain 1/Protein of unknown function (DUF4231)
MTQTGTAVAEAWREQRRWSHAAAKLKSRITFWRSALLASAALGAVLATLATQVGLKTGAGRALSLVAAIAIALVPAIRGLRLRKDDVQSWTRVRSVSEGLKAEVYLYLTRTPPYHGADRDAQLTQHADAITGDADDLASLALGQPDADMPLPTVTDLDSYLTTRVQPQIDGYYRPGAAKQQRGLNLFRGIEFGLALLGTVLGAVAAATGTDQVGVWVAVVTTVGAAIAAHIAASQYEHLVVTYLSTARQLHTLVQRWRDRGDRGPEAATQLVRACEDTISRENESWMAAWTRDEGSAPPGA